MIPTEQIPHIKEQLLKQIESTFPDDKKQEAIKQIKTMDAEQLEQFLIQNNLVQQEDKSGEKQKCVFCSIVFGDIPSTKIAENGKAIAILELNPISNGHTIIIPKDHISEAKSLPKESQDLAKQVSEKLKKEFNPKNILIESSNLFGHEIINVLPIYDNETLASPKKQATPDELAKLQNKLVTEKEQKQIPENKIKKLNAKDIWLPQRIP